MVDVAYRGRVFHLDGVTDGDHIVRVMADSGTFYEADLLAYIEAVKDVLPPGVAVDVGANIGNHAVFLATFVRPVVAFEPNPDLLGLLERNLTTNGVECRIVARALGATRARGTVVVPDGSNLGNAHIETGGGDIEVTTLDEECDEQVALIKVDVEGMELQVLQGAVETITRCRPHLFLEAASRQHLHELKVFLRPLGYRPIVRWCVTPTWHFAPSPTLRLRARARWMRCAFLMRQLWENRPTR